MLRMFCSDINLCVFLIILIGNVNWSLQIYDAKDVSTKPTLSLDRNWYPKYTAPSQLQTGIKTTQKGSGDLLQMHHNYSRINYQRSTLSQTVAQNVTSTHQTETSRSNGVKEKLFAEPNITIHNFPYPPLPKQTFSFIGSTNLPTSSSVTNYDEKKTFPKLKRTQVEGLLSCPKHKTGQYPYALSCRQFLNCWKGRGYIQNCPSGTLFNSETLECDYPDKVKCVAYKYQANIFDKNNGVEGNLNERSSKSVRLDSRFLRLEDFPSTSQVHSVNSQIHVTSSLYSPSGTEKSTDVKCPAKASGLIPHPSDCSKYLNCDNGRTFIQVCGTGTVYNPNIQACDFPQNVQCGNSAVTEEDETVSEIPDIYIRIGQDTQSPMKRKVESSAQIRTGKSQRIERLSSQSSQRFDTSGFYDSSILVEKIDKVVSCQKGVSGLFPHPNDCNKFLNCDNGRTFIQSCGVGTVFSPTIHACDFPQNVDCHYKDETKNDDDDDGGSPEIDIRIGRTDKAINTKTQQQLKDQKSQHLLSFLTPNVPNRAITIQCPKPSGLFSHPQDCSKFLNCLNGQFTVQNCGKGTVFNPKTNICDFPHNVNCDSEVPKIPEVAIYSVPSMHYYNVPKQQNSFQKETNKNKPQIDSHSRVDEVKYRQGYSLAESRTNHVVLPKCPPNFSGLLAHPTDCAKYLNCGSGRTFIHDCGIGTVFNPKILVCDYPNNVQCSNYESGGNQYTQTFNQISSTDQLTAETQHYGSLAQRLPENFHQALDNAWQNYLISLQEQTTVEHNVQEFLQSSIYAAVCDLFKVKCTDYRLRPSGNHILVYDYNARQDTSGRGNIFVHISDLDKETNIKSHQIDQNRISGTHKGSNYTVQILTTTLRPYPVYIPPQQQEEDTNFGVYDSKYDNKIDKNDEKSRTENSEHDMQVQHQLEVDLGVGQNRSRTEEWDPQQHHFYDIHVEKAIVTLDQDCSKDRFECARGVCVPLWWVCDGVKQCPNGKDEEHCVKYLNDFNKRKEARILYHDIEKWLDTDLNTCAKYCLGAQSYTCKSFNYRSKDRSCLLSDSNSGISGDLTFTNEYDYYERKEFAINCSENFLCDNLKCINKTDVCNSVDDCNDNSDEKYCTSEQLGYSIRLVGSSNSNEGRLEVKAFGRWGMVCDDKFGLRDAEVACRELGFPLGAVQVHPGSYFYPESNEITVANNTLIVMDDVECLGNETSLKDCGFNGWGVHDCLPQEVVGIVCKTPTEVCPVGYWRCATTNDECIPLAFLCDYIDDCEDKSDENPAYCDAEIALRLVNGTDSTNGRVEIQYHGVWGTICDDDFSDEAATVICRSLGFHGPAVAKKEGVFGPGSGPIWLDQVNCLGNETFIGDCLHDDWGHHNCEHDEDAAVICTKTDESAPTKSPNAVRYPTVTPKKTISTIFPSTCGLRDEGTFSADSGVAFRVVAGSKAVKGHYPWQASLRIKGQSRSSHWCGAVIITHLHVLTAAHCLIGFSKGSYIVRAGDYESEVEEGTEAEAYMEEFYIHEDFRKGHHMNNDIALVKLKSGGLPLENAIGAICLPEKTTEYFSGKNCTISGWGSTESGKSAASLQLRAGWVPIQSQQTCRMPHVYGESIKDGMFCAGNLDEGVDACDGDSGGPLACLDNGFFTLYGLTSWGQHCGYANKPGVYVKVAHYADWIRQKIEESLSG